MRLDRAFEGLLERRQAHARELGVRPPAADEVRPAARAEALLRALVRLVGRDELATLDNADVLGPGAPAHRAASAGDLLAARAVAGVDAQERDLDLEPNRSAPACPRERTHAR